MAICEWSKAMSVGVPVLDSDHKAPIELINALQKDGERDEVSTRLDEVFEQLAIYVDYHFAREESVMHACNYPATVAHREEHRKIAKDIQRFHEQHKRGEIQIGQEFLEFLKDWLNHHILIQDMDYKKYAAGNPGALDAAEGFGPGLSDPNWKRIAEREAPIRRAIRIIATVRLHKRILEWQAAHPNITWALWGIVWIVVMTIIFWPEKLD